MKDTKGTPPRAADEHQRNLQLQALAHPLVENHVFRSIEEYVLYLMHRKSYEEAATLCVRKDVLDWGCNVGYGMEILLSTASSVSGLDLSPAALETARKRVGKAARDIQLYDGTRCNFADSAFDVVTSFQVLEHISDYETYFREILRVLRPGGVVIFATPNAALRLVPGMKPWNEFHVHEFTAIELQEFLSKWFAAVDLRGLFGKEELYSVERNRVERAKRLATKAARARPIRAAIRRFVKRAVPWLVRIRAKVLSRRPGAQPPPLDSSQLPPFSTRDLLYKDSDLDEALDLFAVCQKTPCN